MGEVFKARVGPCRSASESDLGPGEQPPKPALSLRRRAHAHRFWGLRIARGFHLMSKVAELGLNAEPFTIEIMAAVAAQERRCVQRAARGYEPTREAAMPAVHQKAIAPPCHWRGPAGAAIRAANMGRGGIRSAAAPLFVPMPYLQARSGQKLKN
jgi:hypothetical protein